MKNWIASLSLLASVTATAQVTEQEAKLRSQPSDTTQGWKKGAIINIGITQTSLTNWAAGGQASFSANALFSAHANYRRGTMTWDNSLDVGYGFLQQGKSGVFQKTDDKIDLFSKYGKKAKGNWYYSGILNFKTQMTNGYASPSDTAIISKFMAPGYLIGAIGLDYKPSAALSVFIAPITSKNTFVLDQGLSNAGAFGVTPGQSLRSEFGGYIRLMYNRNLMENITFQTKLDLFSNYLENPTSIDVSWETLWLFKINKYFTATLNTHLIYDQDIDIKVDANNDGVTDAIGPRVQYKQVIALGFNYKF